MGTAFGIGSPIYPVQPAPWGISPFAGQFGTNPLPQHQIQQTLQTLQVVPFQLQQLQQLQYVEQQQLQQLLQIIPAQLQQLQQVIQLVTLQIQQLPQHLQAQQLFGQVTPGLNAGLPITQPFGGAFGPPFQSSTIGSPLAGLQSPVM